MTAVLPKTPVYSHISPLYPAIPFPITRPIAGNTLSAQDTFRRFYQNRPGLAYPLTGGLIAGLAAGGVGLWKKIRPALQDPVKKQPLSKFDIYTLAHDDETVWKPGQTDEAFLPHIREFLKKSPFLQNRLGKTDNVRFLPKDEPKQSSEIGIERLTGDEAFTREVMKRFENIFKVPLDRSSLTLGNSLKQDHFAEIMKILDEIKFDKLNNTLPSNQLPVSKGVPLEPQETKGFLIHGRNGNSILVTSREVIEKYLLKWLEEAKAIAASKRTLSGMDSWWSWFAIESAVELIPAIFG